MSVISRLIRLLRYAAAAGALALVAAHGTGRLTTVPRRLPE